MVRDKTLNTELLIERLEIHTTLAGLESSWRELQDAGFTTPYQTYDWIRHWVDSLARPLNIQPIFVLCFSKDDQLQALFPFGIEQKKGFRILSFLGGKHANFNLGLFTNHAMEHLTKADILYVFQSVSKKYRTDLFRLDNQPMQWNGLLNPVAQLESKRSPSSAWKTALQADGQAMIAGLMSSESRKKLRHKQKRLSELGEVTYLEARDTTQAQRMLDAFFSQKAARFKLLGISNPFAEQSVINFITHAARENLPEKHPAISLYAMMAGERVLSVFGGSIHGGRFTGMFTSFDAEPTISKYSPGDLLLMNLVTMMCDKGLHTFDLGTGEANYKGDYCDTEEPLFDTLLPMTLKGRLLASVLSAKHASKRWIKQNGPAMAIVQRLRQFKSR
jgi:CelD/BcsL family acetyltransferase involved in cellulose biosynthesis